MKNVIAMVLVLTLAGLVLPGQPLGAPGQPILVADTGIEVGFPLRDLAVAEDGTMFAVFHGDPDLTLLHIYRSNNGGSTWQQWGELDTMYGDGLVDDARIVVTPGDPGRLVVAWVDKRLDFPAKHLRVSVAPIDTDEPTWTRTDLHLAANYDMYDPRLDTISFLGGLNRVHLAWMDGVDVMYAASYDSGETWSTPLAAGITTAPATRVKALDVAADNLDVVHLVWSTYSTTGGGSALHYRRAVGGGLFPADWGTTQDLHSLTVHDIEGVTVAADPSTGEGVVVAASPFFHPSIPLAIFESDDTGLTWGTMTGVLNHFFPEAAWGNAGPFIGADTQSTESQSTEILGNTWSVLSPVGSTWESQILYDQSDAPGVKLSGVRLAVDQAHGGQPMLVGVRQVSTANIARGLWWSALWRGDPGFGVPQGPSPYQGARDMAQPVLPSDLDGDGDLELVLSEVAGDGDDYLRIFDPQVGEVTYINYEFNPAGDMALIDADGDGDREVFWFRAWDGFLEGRQGDGSSLAGFPRDVGLGAGPLWVSGARVTGADAEDVVAAGDNTVTVLGPGGAARPGWPWTAPPAGGQVNGRVALGDVDGDGRCELVVPLTGRVAILTDDGQVQIQFGEGEAAAGTPSLADINGDGDLEIAIPRADGTVHLVHHDGTPAGTAWPFDTGAVGMPSAVALADLAGDERRDLVFTDAAHVVRVVTPAGIVALERSNEDLPVGEPVVEPVAALVGPEAPAVCVGLSDGRMRVITMDGRQDGWPRDLGAPVQAPASVADTDADGVLEMVVPNAEQLWVFDMGVAVSEAADLKLWPISGFDVARSGCAEAFVPQVSGIGETTPAAAATVALRGAAPNPFNPVTTISYEVNRPGPVSLAVYDLRGRLVSETVPERWHAAGEYTVRFEAGASGVYLVRLRGGGTEGVLKVVAVK